MSPRLHASARKHFERDRFTDEAVLYAYEHTLSSRPLDDEDDPQEMASGGYRPVWKLWPWLPRSLSRWWRAGVSRARPVKHQR